MATSQQQWRHGRQLILVVAVALALVLFVGSADADPWKACPKGYKDCNPHKPGCETRIDSDPRNCGDCGVVCKYGECKYGKCTQSPKCKEGYGDCDGKKYNGCEKDLRHDIYNCGKCGKKCPCTLKWGEPTCNWGTCGQQCKRGWKYDNVKKCCVKGH